MTRSRLEKITAFFFFIAAAIYFLVPIVDPDFPWHIKTGEYIYQHGEIPKADPFSIASTGSQVERFLLSQYWLAQVIFYLIFSTIGPLGIVILRSLIFAGIIAILWSSMKEASTPVKVFVLYLTVVFFLNYRGDRPQLFTFLLAAIVVVMLENYRKTASVKWLALLPVVMLFWANVHGGFVLGNVLIIIVCLSEAVKYFFIKKPAKPLGAQKLLWLLLIGIASIIISYLNPNSSYAYIFAYDGATSPFAKSIVEYKTPLEATQGPFAGRDNFIYWGIMGYSLVLLALNLRRADITHLGLVFFTLYMSLNAVRFAPFFVMTALIISGQYNSGIKISERFTFLKKLQIPVNVLVFIVVLFWGGHLVYSHPGTAFITRLFETRLYPESAVLFLEQKVPGARMFNSHSTGSYLLFRLYPKFKVFLDTRAYNAQILQVASDISYAMRWDGDYSLWDSLNELLPKDYGRVEVSSGAKPASMPKKEKWLKLLDEYNIDIIVHEASNFFTGRIYPLALSLIKNEEWKLVYSDGKVMIFVRDIPKFKSLITKYEMKKEKIYDEIGMENAPRLGGPYSGIYSSLAFVVIMKGGSDELADEYIKHALFLDPKDILASYLEAFLTLKKRKE